MNFTFNTQIVNVSVTLNALRCYREGLFKDAVSYLIEILDREPQNWQARLMLGACYYKTNDIFASQRSFEYIREYCKEEDVIRKAGEGVQACKLKMSPPQEIPAEFGCHIDRKPLLRKESWLDEPSAPSTPSPQKQIGKATYRW